MKDPDHLPVEGQKQRSWRSVVGDSLTAKSLCC